MRIMSFAAFGYQFIHNLFYLTNITRKFFSSGKKKLINDKKQQELNSIVFYMRINKICMHKKYLKFKNKA